MGSADIVPGISGGTMAFIMGIYEDLIYSVRRLDKLSSWYFLLPLIAGITTAFLLLAGVFHNILNDQGARESLYATFLGLILASIWLLTKQMKTWNTLALSFLILGGILGFMLTGTSFKSEEPYSALLPLSYTENIVNYQQGKITGLSLDQLHVMKNKGYINSETFLLKNDAPFILDPATKTSGFNIYLMLAGMVAITAMLLPGISGSYLLNIMGLYAPAIGAVADFSAGLKSGFLDYEAFQFLLSMAVGIALGAALFSHAIAWLLKHYHAAALALLTGFMVGALKTVWPFWQTAWIINPLRLDKGLELIPLKPLLPDLTSQNFYLAILFMLFGFTLVQLIDYTAKKRMTKIKNERA